MKKSMMTLALFFVSYLLMANIPDLEIMDKTLSFDGDVRTRIAYLNNFDMNYDEGDHSFPIDIRSRFGLLITDESPFYFNMKLELGNIDINEELEFSDFYQLELKQAYFGFKSETIKAKWGYVDASTQGSYIYDANAFGVQVKKEFNWFDLKTFLTLPNLMEEDFSWLDSSADLNYLLYLSLSKEVFIDLDLWSMAYLDQSDADYTYYSLWFGLETAKDFEKMSIEWGYSYNGGRLLIPYIPISAYYTHGKVKYEASKRVEIFSSFHLTSQSDDDYGTINQFQGIRKEAEMESKLGLLFGGSAYSSQSYFNDNTISIVSDDLSNGNAVFNDPGLFIYEWGVSYDFKKVLDVDLVSEFVVGGANTGDLFSGAGYFDSLIGWEADIHNSWSISKYLDFQISLAYLLPGNAFNGVYELNEGETLSLDSSFKVDCSVKYSF